MFGLGRLSVSVDGRETSLVAPSAFRGNVRLMHHRPERLRGSQTVTLGTQPILGPVGSAQGLSPTRVGEEGIRPRTHC